MEKNRYYGTLPAVWQAKWIDPELPHDPSVKQPASVLRKQFEAGTISSAVLYMTCHGLYEAYLNGQRVGNYVLAPGTGDYRKRLCVQAYDVSDLLKTGTNELIVTLGDGWYRGSVGIDGLRNYYGEDIALLCQLEADGKAVCFSDETWEASQQGPIRVNDLQQGETYDARKEEITDWHPVTVRDFDYRNLKADQSVPVREQERFAGRIIKTPNGETVIDFGQNLAGYTELHINTVSGQKITLWHGETLDENGNFTQTNFDPGDRNKNGGIPQKIEYVCKDGENIYHPSF
ncbi:MAG: family 78 glycoside hydrolase catalytic domain, partial [Solobacterium sp.]|nr:family 78 glycoside hydrolase catalytic domain [Solobacterium sp.]